MVKTGLDVLLENYLSLLKGKRVGIITNPSGVTGNLELNVDALAKARVDIRAIYAPEHGFRAAAKEGEKVDTYIDPETGITVYSLYGASHKPSAEMLQGIDVLIYDLQDGGARFYTFISTLLEAAESCVENGKSLMVLDRPDPVNGNDVEGNLLDMNFKSFVGSSPIPIRYGLTPGELIRFYNAHFQLSMKEYIAGISNDSPENKNLFIIPMQGWEREMWFDQTGLQWVPPSPNFATPDTAIVFPGCCFVEGINASEGRGTVKPFEWIGAPYIHAEKWASQLNSRNLPGVIFRPNYFIPKYSKHEGKMCNGIQVHVTNMNSFIPTLTGLHIIQSLYQLYPNELEWIKFSRYFFDNLLGTDTVREAIINKQSLETVIKKWKEDSEEFKKIRKPYLIY
jgi:beta-N-acetylhexosaminidase